MASRSVFKLSLTIHRRFVASHRVEGTSCTELSMNGQTSLRCISLLVVQLNF